MSAADQGWVKLTDPATGKEFYANKFTRQTQWEAPPGFTDPTSHNSHDSNPFASGASHEVQHGDKVLAGPHDDDLPPNWERMKDEASGRFFYVDHVHKKTTWEHPGKALSNNVPNGSSTNSSGRRVEAQGMTTGFGFVPASVNRMAAGTNGVASTSHAGSSSAPSSHSSAWKNMHSGVHSTVPHSHMDSSTRSYEYSFKPSISAVDDKSTKYYSSVLPSIDFKVVKVPDSLRSSCPSCDSIFSLSKRRHHCRLCGDIFCDACSSHRVILPLGGTEFEKPVRVCNECHVDVDKGNYFSMRRYLTPLLLYDEEKEADFQKAFGNVSVSTGIKKNDDGSAVESIDVKKVCAALTSLTQDLDAVMLNATSFGEKVTIPPDVLIPAITRHLALEETSDRAIKALSTLLCLGSIVGDNSFAATVFLHRDASRVLDSICKLLEWSGTSTKTLAVQEQAAKTMYYLTDKRVFSDILEMEEANGNLLEEGWMNSAVMLCDVPRVLRSMLDHTTCTESTSLQRWSAACIRNLIGEDERRGCEAVSEAMSMGYTELRYDSFITELVSSGGAMILSSLVSSDDADTRAHAMAALSQIIDAARDLNVRLKNFMEAYQITNVQTCSETAIIEAVVSSGACGPYLAQLLLSADNISATMACDFARSLIFPIISRPCGTSVPRYHRLFTSDRTLADNQDGLKEYREAALKIGASDGVLSALVHLLKDDYGAHPRPIELRRCATQILAAIAHTLAYWESEVKICGKSIETMDDSVIQLCEMVNIAITTLEEENAAEIVAHLISSSTIQSLNTSRDNPGSQLKEAAALAISALSSCSCAMADVFMSSNVLSRLISLSLDDGFDTPSSRGEWCSRRLPMLEAAASLLVHGWKTIQSESTTMIHDDSGAVPSSRPLELLLEALDAGVVPLVSRILNSKQEFTPSEKLYADTRTKIAACHIVAASFGIARCDSTKIGYARMFEAIGSRHPIISQVLYLLGLVIPVAQNDTAQGKDREKDLPMRQLVEATLLAAGSVCGSQFLSFGSSSFNQDYDVTPGLGTKEKDVFSAQFQEICVSASDIITQQPFLPSALIGSFGEVAILPTLRVLSTVAENSSVTRVYQQIVRSGVLLPLTDMLKDAMNAGDYYVFDACVATIGYSGPQMNSSAENNSVQALRDCVKMFANLISIDDKSESSKLKGLKEKCIKAVEMLSSNSSLWTVIVAHFVPNFIENWLTFENAKEGNTKTTSIVCAGLKTILRVIALPTHAVFVANTGLAASLSNMLCVQDNINGRIDAEAEGMAIQIINTLLIYSGRKGPSTERIEPGVVDVYALDIACHLLARDNHQDHNVAMTTTMHALEILLTVLDTFDDIQESDISKSTRIIGFIETIASYDSFLQKLCATAIFSPFHDAATSEQDSSIRSLYGNPCFMFEGSCGKFAKSADAALNILFWTLFYSLISHSPNSGVIWDTFTLEGKDIADQFTKYAAICTASANFLNIITQEDSICLPRNPSKLKFYQGAVLPMIQERLLHILSLGCAEILTDTSHNYDTVSFQDIFLRYSIPQLCLKLAHNHALMREAYEVLCISFSGYPSSLLENAIANKQSLMSLFHFLGLSDTSTVIERETRGKMKVFSATILSTAGERLLLGEAVNQAGIRSFAVASLSAACIVDDDDIEAIVEYLTEEGMSMSTLCLNGLIDVLSSSCGNDKERKIMLSTPEANAISRGLGKKLSSMVIERFLHKAEREDVLGDVDENDKIQRHPEVTLLCALASSKDSLAELCTCGGLEALSLVASEGELSAINALLEVCKVDPSMVLGIDGHISALQVISRSDTSQESRKACFSLLTLMSNGSRDGRDAIANADECISCVEYASKTIKLITAHYQSSENQDAEYLVEGKGPVASMIELEVISFLTCLLPNDKCRDLIFSDEDLLLSVEALAKEAPKYELQQCALLYLDYCARFIQYDSEDAHHFADMMCSSLLNIIDSSQRRRKSREVATSSLGGLAQVAKTHQFNENLVLASACQVLGALIRNMSLESLSKVFQSLSLLWNEMLSFYSASSKRTTSKTRNSGALMLNISSIYLLLVCRSDTQSLIQSSGAIEDLFRCILLDLNGLDNMNKQHDLDSLNDINNWRGAVTQSLQCLAVLTMNPKLRTTEGKSWQELIHHVESSSTLHQATKSRVSLANPQPSKPSQSILKALEKLADSPYDPLCSIMAKKVVKNLFL